MIGMCFFLGALFSDFPEWKEEFDLYEEVFDEGVVMSPSSPINVIAGQEHRESLLAYVLNHQTGDPYLNDLEIEELVAPLISKGSAVIDYGMGLSPFLVSCAKIVHAFEWDLEVFAKRYWQLNQIGAENALLYYTILRELNPTLDEFDFKEVSLICVSCKGRENLFLKGASHILEEQKPALLIHLLGGLPLEQGDRYVKEEFEKRIEEILKKGYQVHRIRGDLHLALPL